MDFLTIFRKKPRSHFPPLHFYNTLSGAVEPFIPLSSREVKLYNCGPTVYDRQHIGNLRGQILADTIRRSLETWGYAVQHVSNITDVGHLTGDNSGNADTGEDRMEASAKKRGTSAQAIAEEITQYFFEDLDNVGVVRKKMKFPKATAYIPEQIALVKALKEKGYAYHTSDGVYFDTAKYPSYGKLGNIDLTGLEAGARIVENPEKKNPYDFALWKLSKPKGVREQEWDSPWGVGFPGWHIECTAMIFILLGKQIDIHIGGIDLAPIHHNNEIAQAESITGKPFVRHWIHNAFITIENKKVSKSLGNTIYLHNIIDRGYQARALRYWYLTGHYRSPMNFTWETLEGANTALTRLTRFFFEELQGAGQGKPDEKFSTDFRAAIADDLDTPKAVARVWELVKAETISKADKRASLLLADEVLGLGLIEERASTKLGVVPMKELPADIKQLIKERDEARDAKEYEKADALRTAIEKAGYELKDTPQGTKISKQ